MSFICCFCPEFMSLLIYLKKYEKKKNNNLLYRVCYYFLSVLFVNFLILIITHTLFKTPAYTFTVIFSIKYIVLASVISLFTPFVFDRLIFAFNEVNVLLLKYKIFHKGFRFQNLKKLYLDYHRKIDKILFGVTFLCFFILLDVYIRKQAYDVVGFYDVFSFCPNFLTFLYSLSFLFIIYFLSPFISKVLFWFLTTFYFALFFIHYMLLNIKQEAFTVYDIYNLDEGFKYTNFISETISMEFVLFFLLLLILLIFSFKLLIKVKREQVFPVKRFKKFLIILVLFLLARVVTLFSLESYDETAWEKIMFPKYYYDNFINPKKSLSVIGLYEYTSRDFWLFLKERFSTYGTKEEIDEILSNNNAVYEENEKTGIFSGKNLIMIMMESIDNAVVNEEVMPTLSYMKKNGWSFTERYSASNSGGSTIATEFTSMTGLFYNNKDKKYVKNNYKYSLPNQFVSHGYYVSSVHENHGMYYDRDILHKSLGFQNSYFLYDILENPNYYDDSQIILNDEIYDAIIPKNSDDHFMTFIITMAAHGPYTNNSVCYDYDSNMTEKECLEYLAGKTDDLLKVLLSRLEEDGLLDDTVIILYTDHQAYSYNYPDNYLNSLKKIDNNYNIKSIPFIIYSNGISSEVYDDILVNDIDLLPTILNLFGIEYDPNYYLGTDLFSDLHKNLVMFNDYSWYDGEIYSAEASSFKDVDYFEEISNYVEDKVNLSRIIISTDYYNYLFN